MRSASRLKRLLRICAGLLALPIGIAGLVLPVLPGWPFILIGIIILSDDVPLFRTFLAWLEQRFPRLRKPLRRFRRWVE